MTTPLLLSDLERDEGCELAAYPDPLSPLAQLCYAAKVHLRDYRAIDGWQNHSGAPWTIGYGHTSPDIRPGLRWTQEQADEALKEDADRACAGLDRELPWWRQLNDTRQDVVASMAFNLGLARLKGFHNTLAAMQAEHFDAAADGMLQSLWAKQVGQRAQRLAHMMRTGAR